MLREIALYTGIVTLWLLFILCCAALVWGPLWVWIRHTERAEDARQQAARQARVDAWTAKGVQSDYYGNAVDAHGRILRRDEAVAYWDAVNRSHELARVDA